MFGIFVFAGAALAGMWGTRTAAGLLIGSEVVRGRMLKHEMNQAFDLDVNPKKEKSFGLIEITAEEVPNHPEFVGKYIFSKQEAAAFLTALQEVVTGGGDFSSTYDFEMVKKIQEKRRGDDMFAHLLRPN
jgi:hypothetical protein